jgi:hypothetical protein
MEIRHFSAYVNLFFAKAHFFADYKPTQPKAESQQKQATDRPTQTTEHIQSRELREDRIVKQEVGRPKL